MRSVTGPLLKGGTFFVVTAVVTLVLGITIANVSTGTDAYYTARFDDASSVDPGDEVRMSGVRIGEVEGVDVAGRRFAEVRFSVRGGVRITADATVAIKYRNMVGSRYLSIQQGPESTTDHLETGGRIPNSRTDPALDLTALFNGFKPLFQALSPEDVNQLSYEIVRVLQGQGGTVSSLIKHIASLTSTLASKDAVIGRVVDNLNSVLAEVNSKSGRLARLIDTTERLTRGLASDAEPIADAIGGIGELTTVTADLLSDGRTPLHNSITALRDLSGNLADNTGVFEEFLANLPVKLDRLGTLASYGSWFNMYLCGVTSDAPRPPGGDPVGIPVTQARCTR